MRKTQNLLILLVILAMLLVPVIGVVAQEEDTHSEADTTEVVTEETTADEGDHSEETTDDHATDDGHGSSEQEVPAGLTLGIFLAGLGAVATVGAFAYNKERSAAKNES